jgi:hypothetical protein
VTDLGAQAPTHRIEPERARGRCGLTERIPTATQERVAPLPPFVHSAIITLKRLTITALILAGVAIAAAAAPAQPPDTQPPVFLGADVNPKTINPFGSTVITYEVNEDATVKAAFKRALSGRKVKGRCRKATRRNRGSKRCTRLTNVGTLEQTIASKTGSISFVGLMRGKPLKVGSYRIELTATDVAANKSKITTLKLRVKRP